MTVPCQGAEAPSAREGLCGANRVKAAEVPTNVKEVVARFALHAWPLYPGEVVEIEKAALGQDAQVVTAVCLAHLSETLPPLYVACHPDDCPRAVALYRQRPAVEQQNRDLKRNFRLSKLHLKTPARLERLWVILGLAFYISYCNATAHETAFVERMSRRYKDGRRDLSWLNRAKYAELCGHVEVLLAPICAEHAQR